MEILCGSAEYAHMLASLIDENIDPDMEKLEEFVCEINVSTAVGLCSLTQVGLCHRAYLGNGIPFKLQQVQHPFLIKNCSYSAVVYL